MGVEGQKAESLQKLSVGLHQSLKQILFGSGLEFGDCHFGNRGLDVFEQSMEGSGVDDSVHCGEPFEHRKHAFAVGRLKVEQKQLARLFASVLFVVGDAAERLLNFGSREVGAEVVVVVESEDVFAEMVLFQHFLHSVIYSNQISAIDDPIKKCAK